MTDSVVLCHGMAIKGTDPIKMASSRLNYHPIIIKPFLGGYSEVNGLIVNRLCLFVYM